MATFKEFCCVIVLTVITYLIEAKPTCHLYDNGSHKDMICSPGDDDYVLKRGLVSDNNATTRVTLKACKITDIDLESFHGLLALKHLDLSLNKLGRLQSGVLDEVRQVTYLNLSYNTLTDFPLGLFNKNPNLEVLDLKGNTISSDALGVFDPLQKLTHLDLSSNSILGTNLNPYIFDKIHQIKFLDFSRNDMSGSPVNLFHAFQSLEILNLDRCLLKDVPSFPLKPNLKTLKHLILSNNQIININNAATFIELDNLEILDLTANIITDVNGEVFKPLKKLKKILLRNNRLKNIPDNLFQNMVYLGNIDISHNFIEYVPVNAFRGTALKNLNLAVNRFTYLQDNFCLELKNSGARLTKFYFNQNPWQCTCLRELLNEVKMFNVEYNNVKYKGEEPVCVTTNDFYCKRHKEFNDFYMELYDELVHG